MNLKINLSVVVIFLISLSSNAQYSDKSKLAEGQIVKIAIQETGIYKIDQNFISNNFDVAIGTIDPRRINIYGSGGAVLPQMVGADRVDDMESNSIFIQGEEDGSFDSNDYIVFYGEGPDTWSYDSSTNKYAFKKNIYDVNNYYFIKIDDSEPSNRIEEIPSLTNASVTLDTRDQKIHYENDVTNLLGAFSNTEGTGQMWFGESFGINNIQDFTNKFQFRNLKIGGNAEIKVTTAGRGASGSSMKFIFGDEEASMSYTSVSIGNNESIYARLRSLNLQHTISSANNTVALEYNASSGSDAWLDFIEVIAPENLVYNNQAYFISNRESVNANSAAYQVTNGNTSLHLWDISQVNKINNIQLLDSPSGISFASESEGQLKEFVLFDPSASLPTPSFVELVENQNLHGIDRADLLIIYPTEFEEAAMKLKQHRSEFDNLIVEAVNIDKIYNEFASGKKDVTALRDFVKMVYERDPNFNYLLLLGDASYDYRVLVPNLDDQNFVPTYETIESLSPINGFPSDDYFALLSDNEGVDMLKGALDIAVGRLPARSLADANGMINKIIHYDTSPKLLGDWKLNIGFTADDEDTNTHISDADEIAVKSQNDYPVFNQQKVYFDAYSQESTPGGARYPDANQTINENIEKGQLILNYLGHGGPKGWAQERVLQINDINNWTNFDRLPIVITATCSFTGFDDPGLISAGEHAISNPNGGAVALLTTVRAVYASENRRLTEATFDEIFQTENGNNKRLGEIMRLAKNANSEDTLRINARKFALIGDPSMRIATPENKVVLNSINDQDITVFKDTLKALSTIKIKGFIADYQDQKLNDFNGLLFATLYDKEAEVSTLANDESSYITKFNVRKNILFKGSASVNNGDFEIEFIIPKDINYNFGEGKISLYAHDQVSKDAAGYFDDLIIGGSSIDIADNQPPLIELFMNDENFVSGGITDQNPTLLIKLSDDYGINVSGNSIGHDLTMVLDDQNDQSTILNDFYEAETDNYRNGTVNYPLKDLEPGMHKVHVKAWDISNNSNEEEIEFMVVDPNNEDLFHVFNYPNPFSTSTKFTFEHDLVNSDINIGIEIYTISGKVVKTIESSTFSAGFRIDDMFWDGRDDYGSKLASGIYLYKVKISSPSTGLKRESDFQKIVLL